MRKQTKSLFVACVAADRLLTAIMLPNTKHIPKLNKNLIRNKINDVIGFHNSKKVSTGHLVLDDEKGLIFNFNSPNTPKTIKTKTFAFQKCKKRFLAHDLINDQGELTKPNKSQQAYLDSTLLSHAWVALHKGHIVGLITYPYLNSHKLHDATFFRYQSLARTMLQQVGFVVACDMVLTPERELKFFNIHRNYVKDSRVYPFFTRELPFTSHLSLTDCD